MQAKRQKTPKSPNKPSPKRLSLHPLTPEQALRSALKSGKVKRKSSK